VSRRLVRQAKGVLDLGQGGRLAIDQSAEPILARRSRAWDSDG
jgi:hypothetical protein